MYQTLYKSLAIYFACMAISDLHVAFKVGLYLDIVGDAFIRMY